MLERLILGRVNIQKSTDASVIGFVPRDEIVGGSSSVVFPLDTGEHYGDIVASLSLARPKSDVRIRARYDHFDKQVAVNLTVKVLYVIKVAYKSFAEYP